MEPQLIDQDSRLHGCCPDAVVTGGCRPGPLSTGSVFILARVPAAEKHSRAACQQARSANEPCVLRRAHTSLCLATTCDPGCVKTNNELRVFVPRSRRKSSVGRRGRGALLGAGRIWKFQAGGSDVEAGGAGEMV